MSKQPKENDMDMDEDYEYEGMYDWEIEEMERNIEEGERNTRCEQIRADALGITLDELYAQQAVKYWEKANREWADAVWDIGLIKLYRKHTNLYVIGG